MHKEQCHFKPQPCPECGELITPDEVKKHLISECRLRRVSCEHCRIDVVYAELQVSLCEASSVNSLGRQKRTVLNCALPFCVITVAVDQQ